MNDLEFFSLFDISKERFELELQQIVLNFLMKQNEYLDVHCNRDVPEPVTENFTDMMFTATEKSIEMIRRLSGSATKEGVDMTNKEMGL